MAGIEVGEQQTHRQRLHPFLLQRRERLCYCCLVERHRHLAIPAYALWHPQPQIAWHERLYWGHAQIIAVLFHALAHFEEIAEAGGSEQSDFSAFAFNERIRRHCRAMNEQFRGRQELLRLQSYAAATSRNPASTPSDGSWGVEWVLK